MIHLVQPRGFWGLPNLSPACMKLETWLRLAGIPYQETPLDLARAPKGKVPYVHLEDGTLLGDSTLIIEHLKATRGKEPDASLTAEQRAISLAFRRMMKEDFYWVIVHTRYREERNWERYRQAIIDMLDGVPQEQQEILADMYRKRILEQLQGQGMGRHTADEVHRLGIADVAAVSDFLGDKPFLFGEEPTTADATVSAYLANQLQVPLECPVKDFGLSRDNLVRYLQRIRARLFPELCCKESSPPGCVSCIE
ncbi:MAG TPA: glutathione S-transferase family protein [Myxococcaceae bacterium]|nr:glutathione S-transferase family protein [Myxococcaceae bacterium]